MRVHACMHAYTSPHAYVHVHTEVPAAAAACRPSSGSGRGEKEAWIRAKYERRAFAPRELERTALPAALCAAAREGRAPALLRLDLLVHAVGVEAAPRAHDFLQRLLRALLLVAAAEAERPAERAARRRRRGNRRRARRGRRI